MGAIQVFEKWISNLPEDELVTLLKYVTDELYDRRINATQPTTVDS